MNFFNKWIDEDVRKSYDVPKSLYQKIMFDANRTSLYDRFLRTFRIWIYIAWFFFMGWLAVGCDLDGYVIFLLVGVSSVFVFLMEIVLPVFFDIVLLLLCQIIQFYIFVIRHIKKRYLWKILILSTFILSGSIYLFLLCLRVKHGLWFKIIMVIFILLSVFSVIESIIRIISSMKTNSGSVQKRETKKDLSSGKPQQTTPEHGTVMDEEHNNPISVREVIVLLRQYSRKYFSDDADNLLNILFQFRKMEEFSEVQRFYRQDLPMLQENLQILMDLPNGVSLTLRSNMEKTAAETIQLITKKAQDILDNIYTNEKYKMDVNLKVYKQMNPENPFEE